MARKLVYGALLLAGMASGGCIAVGASKEVRTEPKHQIAVVDDEIYVVDVRARKAWKVQIEGLTPADEMPEQPATMSGN